MRPQKFRLFIPRCAKFAHRVEAWQIFGVPHRLIDPLYQSPPNRDISHDQSPGNFRCLRSSFFFSFFFFSSPPLFPIIFINPSSLPTHLPIYLSTYPLSVSSDRDSALQLEYETWPIPGIGIVGRQTRRGGTKSRTSTRLVVRMHTLPTPNANDLLAYRHKVLAISDRLYVTYS